MAEGVFQSIAKNEPYKGLISKIDSCGTGKDISLLVYNANIELTFEKRATTSAKSQITAPWPHYERRVSRTTSIWDGRYVFPPPLNTEPCHLAEEYMKLRSSDFDNFDYIFAMDKSNLSDILREQRKKPGSKAKVMLFGEYSGTGKVEIVDDPYYGGHDGFETTYEQATRFSKNFLKEVFPDVKPEL